MRSNSRLFAVLCALAWLTFAGATRAHPGDHGRAEASVTRYQFAKVAGVDIFYREAGRTHTPVVVLLPGFPTSSHMFRNLIPLLAERYHVVAPDYPAFGQSG